MTSLEKKLLVIAGPNGSGKSSLVYNTQLSVSLDRIINPDNYARGLSGQISDVVERYRYAIDSCETLRNTLLSQGATFGFETVASREDKLEFVRKAKAAGYFIDFIFVSTSSPELCYERIQDRVKMGGHDVPRDKVFSRYERTMKFLPDYIKIADHAQVWDNSGEGLVLLFEKAEDVSTITDDGQKSDWLKKHLVPFLSR